MLRGLTSASIAVAVLLSGCGASPDTLMVRGFDLYDLGNYEEAHPLLEKAFERGIDDPELVVRLAFCRATIDGDPAGAVNLLRDSALRYPKYARTYYELGFIAQQFGPREDGRNLRQAIYYTRLAVEIDTTEWRFKDNLGICYGLLGQLDSALYWLKAARELKPDHPELNARLEQLQRYLEERAEADSALKGDTLYLHP